MRLPCLGGYSIHAVRGSLTGKAVTVDVRTDVSLDLSVEQEGTFGEHVISGTVTDEDGNRLADALVTMTWGNDKANSATTSTDGLGGYSFTVPDGTYYLTAAYEADNGNRYGTNAESAVHVNGADEAKDLMVLMGYEVAVTVVDRNGDPVGGATVRYDGAAPTGPDGTVSLHLPKGGYRFRAETEGRTSGLAELAVSGPASLTLELENAGVFYEAPDVTGNKLTIWGWTYDPEGAPVPDAEVGLYRQDPETLEWSLAARTRTDGDGRYEFPELDGGTYRVDMTYTYETGAETSEAGHVVAGTLEDEYGDPLSNCRAELWTEGGDLVAEVTTGEDGRYAFEGVDPDGFYVVKAWDASGEPVLDGAAAVTATSTVISGTALDVAGNVVEGAEVAILDAGGNTVATTVTDATGYYAVSVGGKSDGYKVVARYPASYEVDTESYARDTTDRNSPYLEPSWYTIEGWVHDNDGAPVEGATVVLTDASGSEIDRHVTGADGHYVFDHLEDGTYYVRVEARDGAVQTYRVEAGDASDNIRVSVTNYSKGAVTEPDGGWYDGWNSFTVECGLACMVYVDDGESLTKLEAKATGDAGKYRFTADLRDGDGIVVIVRGDADLNGRVTAADLVKLSLHLGGELALSRHGVLAADVDLNGRLTAADLVKLSLYLGGGYAIKW